MPEPGKIPDTAAAVQGTRRAVDYRAKQCQRHRRSVQTVGWQTAVETEAERHVQRRAAAAAVERVYDRCAAAAGRVRQGAFQLCFVRRATVHVPSSEDSVLPVH